MTVFCFCITCCIAQNTKQDSVSKNKPTLIIVNGEPLVIAENKPTFKGKNPEESFKKWAVSKTEYPPLAVENGIKGRVIYEFRIDKKGKLCDIKLIQSAHPLLDAEALRVLKKSPKWEPATTEGKPVEVLIQFPFTFWF